MSPVETARAFAAALDADNFPAAALLLHPECRYWLNEKEYNGPAEIVALYRENMLAARQKYDALEWLPTRWNPSPAP